MLRRLLSKRVVLPYDKHIVIVGAGYGGIKLAEQLQEHHQGAHYTLINPREEFHHNLAACRAAVVPGLAQKTVIPLRAAFGERFLQGRVVSIRSADQQVVLDHGDVIRYDALVLCTGSSGPFPFKLKTTVSTDESLMQYHSWTEKIRTSNEIVVIGGGATGVEMSAEVASAYRDKLVTLVTAHDLLPTISKPSFRNGVKQMLRDKGVNIITNERVINLSEVEEGGCGPVKTDKGTSITADCVLNCNGLRVNADAYSRDLGDHMDEKGRLKVNNYLQVQGHGNIFALGDCCGTKEPKLAYVSLLQAEWLASQMAHYFSGQQMTPYKIGGSPIEMVLALGPDAGVGLTSGGWTLPSWMITRLKSKTLMVPDYWNLLKQQVYNKDGDDRASGHVRWCDH